MGTDYSTPATQSVNGIAPSSWANNVNDDLEAIFEPPSARFIGAANATISGITPSNPDPTAAGSYATVYWMASNQGNPGDTGLESTGQTWQRLVASTSGSGRPYCDDTNSTWAGATISTGTGDDVTPTDVLKVPSAGLWLISWEISTTLTAVTGSWTGKITVNSATVSGQQLPISGTGSTGTHATGSCIVKLTTSDQIRGEARSIGAAASNVGGRLSFIRVARTW